MRRLARHLFTLCSAVSLVLCAAAIWAWVGGYYFPTRVLSFGNPAVEVHMWPAAWQFQSTRPFGVARPALPPLRWQVPRELCPQWVSDGVGFRLQVPYWIPVVVFGTLPARRYWLLKRLARRTRLGRCPACGYDLRASPERCPECGAVPGA